MRQVRDHTSCASAAMTEGSRRAVTGSAAVRPVAANTSGSPVEPHDRPRVAGVGEVRKWLVRRQHSQFVSVYPVLAGCQLQPARPSRAQQDDGLRDAARTCPSVVTGMREGPGVGDHQPGRRLAAQVMRDDRARQHPDRLAEAIERAGIMRSRPSPPIATGTEQ